MMPQRAARRDGAREQARVVAQPLGLRHGDGGDRGSGGDRGPGGRREQRRGADIGVHQPARRPGGPRVERRVGALGDARSHQHLAEQHEEGDGDEERGIGRRPHDLPQAPDEGEGRVEPVHPEGEQEQDHRDRERGGEQQEEPGADGADHAGAPIWDEHEERATSPPRRVARSIRADRTARRRVPGTRERAGAEADEAHAAAFPAAPPGAGTPSSVAAIARNSAERRAAASAMAGRARSARRRRRTRASRTTTRPAATKAASPAACWRGCRARGSCRPRSSHRWRR